MMQPTDQMSTAKANTQAIIETAKKKKELLR